jgi:hypothetical protein
MPRVTLSSILMMRSPALTPARAAGVSSIGAMTLMTPSSAPTSMPSPPNSPWVLDPGQHAGDRFLHQLLVVNGLDVVLLDRTEDLGELTDLFEWDLSPRVAERVRGNAKADKDAGDGTCTDQTNTA